MRDASPRLGRGLAALLGDSPAVPPPVVGMIAIDLLQPNPFQPRGEIREDELEEMVASIRSQGVLQPILIRPDKAKQGRFQIIAGERRWRAAKLAGVDTIPCFIRDMPDTDASAAALVENLQRRDLNAIEEAEGFKRLIEDFGLTQEELSGAIGKSRSHVANTLRLLGLPSDVRAYVQAGTLTAGHARAALACPDPLAAAEQMVSQGLNVRQAEAMALPKAGTRTVTPKPARQTEAATADLRAVEADLAERLGLNVSISFNGRGGTLSLRYQTLEQLDYIVAKLG